MRRTRGAGVVVAAAGLALVLGGCGTPPWQQAATDRPTGSRTPTSSASPSVSASVMPVGGDLADGALSRTIRAGDLTVAVRYWSTVAMADWTPGSDKPLSMSVTATRSATPGTAPVVTLGSATVDVSTRAAGGTDVPDSVAPMQQASDTGFAVEAPQSWSGTFVIGALPARARTMQLVVTLVLREASGGSTAQQTATDVLAVRLA